MKFDRPSEAGEYTEPLRNLDPIIYTLRKARYDQNMSQQALAKHVGCTGRTIRSAENGESAPNFYLLQSWVKALGFKLELTK